jgi:hypothetical protein
LNDDVSAEEFELRKNSTVSDDIDINLKDLRLRDVVHENMALHVMCKAATG